MSRTTRGLAALSRLLLALGASVLAGVLLAAVAVPFVGGLGLAAKAGADDFLKLPTALATPPLATRSRVLAGDGSLLATFFSVNRVSAPMDQIPETARQAIVAIEDSRFYEHHGVDFKGTLRAAVSNAQSGRVGQGGSTLTQQYVKNALIQAATDKAGQQAAREETADRKLREARYALELERTLSKDEILHRYLNVAYYDNGVYGIGTAANYYFNKGVQDLTLGESATLAGVVQNPQHYNVASKDPAVRQDVADRRNTVLARMAQLGDIDEATRAVAAAEPLEQITPVVVTSGCEAPSVVAPFYCEHVRHELEDTEVGAALGATREERQAKLFGGGLTIRTNLNLSVQAAAQATLARQLPATDPSGVAGVTNIVEPGTGKVLAMAVNRPFGDEPGTGATKVNLAEGGTFGYQPGSTFKAFFLAEAIREGIPLDTQINSPASYSSTVFRDCTTRPCKGYTVGNAGDSEAGLFDFYTGTHGSVNTFYLQVEERTGIDKPAALAESLGVKKINYGAEAPLDRVPSLVLGSVGVSPLAMAGAYATFAAHGLFCPPRAVLDITGPGGGAVPVPATGCTQALEPRVADTVTSVLTGVIDGGDPGRTAPNASLGARPSAGKTGTTEDSKAAWFVGYTPQLATAVWIGTITPSKLQNIRINGRYYNAVFGASISAPIWRDTMRAALDGVPIVGFAGPTDSGTSPLQRSVVPDVSGRSPDDAAAALTAAGFTPVQGRPIPGRQRAGRVAATSPRAGTRATPGSTIYIYRSSGPPPAVAPQPTPAPPAQPAAPVAPVVPSPVAPPPAAIVPAALVSVPPPALPPVPSPPAKKKGKG